MAQQQTPKHYDYMLNGGENVIIYIQTQSKSLTTDIRNLRVNKINLFVIMGQNMVMQYISQLEESGFFWFCMLNF